VAVSLIGEGN